ncbi:MAG: excinuclease ABC subunit UvrC [Spirochaetaceae bacterium]|jgi:excinuclease ABC subunit C|nr:excinuclease ABC subunit UvrC [Spirochaetaceae bacterium]
MTTLKETARDAPLSPGCYIMRDGNGKILYVGKARVLRDRLRSYFSGEKDIKTATLLKHAASIETIIVSSEYEAFLLENTLIKQHSPKYNINLKDGKTYPVIRVTHEDFPKIFRTRHIIEDGSKYFGPFPSAQTVDKALELLQKIYPLRKCRRLRKKDAPCMYYHIKRCAAPCCEKIGKGEYAGFVEKVCGLLSGEVDPLVIAITEKMHEAARETRFEKAAEYRDAIAAIKDLLYTNNAVVDFDTEGRDYIAFAEEGVLTTWSVFSMRGGKLTGRELFRAKSAAGELDSIETFMLIFYNADRPPPPRIYLAKGGHDFSRLEAWFKTHFDYVPELLSPDNKRHEAALRMARQNAEEDIRKRVKERGGGPALAELAQVLRLPTNPVRIEGFDIAQLDGKHPVASLISFYNGIPDRKNYRLFKLRTVEGIIDDFQAMREAVGRRYRRLVRENAELPDLILIDGGIGQVNAAKGVLDEIGLACPVAGLAKRDEEVWLPAAKEPIVLSRRSEALKVLQAVRDETHRFATNANQRLRSKDLLLETLQSIEGIGEKKARKIIKAASSLEKIAGMSAKELSGKTSLGIETTRKIIGEVQKALAAKERRKHVLQTDGGRIAARDAEKERAAQELAEAAGV